MTVIFEMPTPLPPSRWAVRQYFDRRMQPNLGHGLTPDEERINDSLWIEIIAGKSVSPAASSQARAETSPEVSLDTQPDETLFPPDAEPRDGTSMRCCEGCGKPLRRKGAHHCSPRCRLRTWRVKRRAA